MAKQTQLYYRGTRGHLVYYELNGGYYIRSKPTQVRQTPATRACATRFGTAVKVSKALRTSLDALLPPGEGRPLMFRLNTALYQWLLAAPAASAAGWQDVAVLKNFSLSEKASFTERFRPGLQVQWTGGGEVIITCPSFNPLQAVAAPAHTTELSLQLALRCCSLETCSITSHQTTLIHIPYGDAWVAARQIRLPWQGTAGELTVMAASLRYQVQGKGGLVTSPEPAWQPACIVEAVWQ